MKLILDTDRLRLRELVETDLPFLTELLGDPVVMRFWPRPFAPEECNGWLQRQLARYREPGYGYWLVCDRGSGEPVGQAGLIPTEIEQRREVSVGYIMAQAHWNRGYATEAAAGCLRYAAEVLGLGRVIAPVRPGNGASERVAMKLGMVVERVVEFAGFPHAIHVKELGTGR